MLVTNLETVPGKRIEPLPELGGVVRCLNFQSVRNYLPLSSFDLGPGVARNQVMEDATNRLLQGMIDELTISAEKVGADAIVGMKLEMSPMGPEQTLFVLFGTAVKYV